MKYLVDQPHEHNYIYLKTESIVLHEVIAKIANKEVYACVDCGLGMDVYDLENTIKVKEPK